MPEVDLVDAAAELDDGYLKVCLLMAVHRARSEEPRRAAFWHAIAVVLAEEQEKRRDRAQFEPGGTAVPPEAAGEELHAVIVDLRAQIASLEAEARESVGDMATASGD